MKIVPRIHANLMSPPDEYCIGACHLECMLSFWEIPPLLVSCMLGCYIVCAGGWAN